MFCKGRLVKARLLALVQHSENAGPSVSSVSGRVRVWDLWVSELHRETEWDQWGDNT